VPLTLTVHRDIAWIRRYTLECQELADAAVEANMFYEPWALIPALQVYANDEVDVCFVWSEDRQLVGVIPTSDADNPRLPFSVATTWRHPRAYLGTPLIRAGWEHAVLDRWLMFVQRTRGPAARARLDLVDPNGPVAKAMRQVVDEFGGAAFDLEQYSRPLWQAGTPLQRKAGRSRRKNLRRLGRRLRERGDVDLRSYAGTADVAAATLEFLRLERSGWKGQQGTALACEVDDRDFFGELVRGAAAGDRSLIQALTLDGVSIAMNIDFRSGTGGFCFKTAYDASLATFPNPRTLRPHPPTAPSDRTFWGLGSPPRTGDPKSACRPTSTLLFWCGDRYNRGPVRSFFQAC
jgi:hypothetical protein